MAVCHALRAQNVSQYFNKNILKLSEPLLKISYKKVLNVSYNFYKTPLKTLLKEESKTSENTLKKPTHAWREIMAKANKALTKNK